MERHSGGARLEAVLGELGLTHVSAARSPAAPGSTKAARIRKRREYLSIQRVGERVKLRNYVFVLQSRPEPRVTPRLGITASRKVGCAVVRNRAKRLVREAFRASSGLFPNDIDVVVIVLQAPPEQRLADVLAEWRSAERTLNTRIEAARRSRDRARP